MMNDTESAPGTDLHDTIDYCRSYVRRGFALTAIRPRDKRPYLKSWGKHPLATEVLVWLHWKKHRDDNVGLILGPASNLCDIEHDSEDGRESLEWLLSDDDKLTPTYVSGKSTHRLFGLPQLPERLEDSNVIAADGIEIRLGLDGQTQSVIPPSVHPSGRTYTWCDGLAPWQVEVRPFPFDVLEYVEERLGVREEGSTVEACRNRPDVVRLPDGDRPGDIYNAAASWEDVLCPHGWRVVGHKGDLTEWTHPTSESGASCSATTGYRTDTGNDVLAVYSNRTPFQTVLSGRHTYTKFEAYAVLNHRGDRTKAAAELARNGYKPQVSANTKRRVYLVG